MSSAKITPEDKRAHLAFIEDAITRMANEANSLKAWLAPIATAAYGYAVVNDSWQVALLGTMASLVLGWQAASYLRQERAFRKLYDLAVQEKVPSFAMNIGGALGPWIRHPSVVLSWSILGYFGIFALAGLVIAICSAA